MHILIAPNAFKNSLTAHEAAAAIQTGLQQSSLKCTTLCFPIADGGDGTGPLIIDKCRGNILTKVVSDPFGRMIQSQFGLIDKGTTAIIEMADASGLRLLNRDELNPLKATSYGTGDLMKFALDEGVSKIMIAMGGSATVDGGCGILSALGVQFFNDQNELLAASPQNLMDLARVDISGLDERVLNCEVIVLCDVNNLLLGPQGSAAVFGPQKGTAAGEVIALDGFLAQLNKIAEQHTGKSMATVKYGGTAGGAAAGLFAFLNAKLVNGIEHFLQITGFDQELQKADLVITGEGSIDAQTLQGKGPFGVARLAKQKNIPVIGLAGKVPLEPHAGLQAYFDVLMAIGNCPADLSDSLKNTKENLLRTSKMIGEMLAFSKTH